MVTEGTLDRRALNRATLARQFLLERATIDAFGAIEHIVGLQAQTPQTWYVGAWSRLDGFDPTELSDLLAGRQVVRLGLMRSTIHLVTARDAWLLRPLIQPVLDRVQSGQFGRSLEGLDLDEVGRLGRAYVETEPRTFKALGEHLMEHYPDRDRLALELVVRARVPLVQVPPRGLWRRSGRVAHTSIEAWLGPPPKARMTLDEMVLRYLAAFGPATIMDAQAWCGLTRLNSVFERLRPNLAAFHDERGKEVFDLPNGPRPHPETPAPPRFLYDYDNVLLSHADRSRMFHPHPYRQIETRTNESISAFTIDGVVSGFWRLARERDSAWLSLRPIVRFARVDEVALIEEGQRLLALLAADAASHDVRFDWGGP